MPFRRNYASFQTAAYHEPVRVRRLHGYKEDPGVISEVANDLAFDLGQADQLPEDRVPLSEFELSQPQRPFLESPMLVKERKWTKRPITLRL